jgi:hypothetical protein
MIQAGNHKFQGQRRIDVTGLIAVDDAEEETV